MIRGQLQQGRVGELLFPVVELRLKHVPLKPLPLPGCEVTILNRQLGKR